VDTGIVFRIRHYWEIRKLLNGHKSAAHTDSLDDGTDKMCLCWGVHCPSALSYGRPDNTVNFGPLAAEICWRVWDTPANFNGFRVLAALLHGTRVVSVSQSLRRWTEGATYIRQGGHHVGHWPTF